MGVFSGLQLSANIHVRRQHKRVMKSRMTFEELAYRLRDGRRTDHAMESERAQGDRRILHPLLDWQIESVEIDGQRGDEQEAEIIARKASVLPDLISNVEHLFTGRSSRRPYFDRV